METVINNPYEFKVRRRAGRRGHRVLGWYPLPKGIAFLPRYAVVDNPAPAYQALDRLAHPVRDAHGRSQRAFNPAAGADLQLFETVLRGEHALHGFRNCDLRQRLFGSIRADRQQSARVSRLLTRLHVRGLIAKIPRSRRWRVTQLGHAVMSAAVRLRDEQFPEAFFKEAA